MSLKHLVVTCAAAMTIALSGALCAQPAPVVEGGAVAVRPVGAPVVEGEAAAVPVAEGVAVAAPTAEGGAGAPPAAAIAPAVDPAPAVRAAEEEAAAAQDYKRMKMDAATAADDKFHADRTQANMIARDQAEAEAAAAIKAAHAAEERATAVREGAGGGR